MNDPLSPSTEETNTEVGAMTTNTAKPLVPPPGPLPKNSRFRKVYSAGQPGMVGKMQDGKRYTSNNQGSIIKVDHPVKVPKKLRNKIRKMERRALAEEKAKA